MINEAKKIQAYLEMTPSYSPQELMERLTDTSIYMARTGAMLADAKKIMRDKKSLQISEIILKIAKENHLSAKAQNALVENIASEECYLVDFIERLNKACTHQCENLRTQISFYKEELKLSKTGY